MTELLLIAAVAVFVLSFLARRQTPQAVRPLRLGALALVLGGVALGLEF